jgi:hypothetical protein
MYEIDNPRSPAPKEILDTLSLISVTHFGFDGKTHEGHIVIHKDLQGDVRDFFSRALELTFPIAKVIAVSDPQYSWSDERSCEDNNTSGFNYRPMTGGTRLSKHALGRAFDVNPFQNPYLRFGVGGAEEARIPKQAVYEANQPGTLSKNHPLVLCMLERGWKWGGNWNPAEGVVDYQHFER